MTYLKWEYPCVYISLLRKDEARKYKKKVKKLKRKLKRKSRFETSSSSEDDMKDQIRKLKRKLKKEKENITPTPIFMLNPLAGQYIQQQPPHQPQFYKSNPICVMPNDNIRDEFDEID